MHRTRTILKKPAHHTTQNACQTYANENINYQNGLIKIFMRI